jgi:hypothetical protein
LRLLIDGLELFADAVEIDRHPRLGEALERVRNWGGAANWDRVLTTLIGLAPDHSLPGTRAAVPILREVLDLFETVPTSAAAAGGEDPAPAAPLE